MPNRILKESICTSDSIDCLSWFEECLYYRLIVNCDDYGRFDGRTAVVKNRLFPLKENLTLKSVSEAIKNLASAGLIIPYECDGKPFLYLPSWNEHQTIRAKKSKYPEPSMKSNEIKCMQMHTDVPVIQSNTNPIRNQNTNAREVTPQLIEEFLTAYPCKGNRHLTEVAFIACCTGQKVSGKDLVEAARNYADRCRILKVQEQYMKLPENFLRDLEYCQYLPDAYVKPKPSKQSNIMMQTDYGNMAELESLLLEN